MGPFLFLKNHICHNYFSCVLSLMPMILQLVLKEGTIIPKHPSSCQQVCVPWLPLIPLSRSFLFYFTGALLPFHAQDLFTTRFYKTQSNLSVRNIAHQKVLPTHTTHISLSSAPNPWSPQANSCSFLKLCVLVLDTSR